MAHLAIGVVREVEVVGVGLWMDRSIAESDECGIKLCGSPTLLSGFRKEILV
jgi:hypothetical protein